MGAAPSGPGVAAAAPAASCAAAAASAAGSAFSFCGAAAAAPPAVSAGDGCAGCSSSGTERPRRRGLALRRRPECGSAAAGSPLLRSPTPAAAGSAAPSCCLRRSHAASWAAMLLLSCFRSAKACSKQSTKPLSVWLRTRSFFQQGWPHCGHTLLLMPGPSSVSTTHTLQDIAWKEVACPYLLAGSSMGCGSWKQLATGGQRLARRTAGEGRSWRLTSRNGGCR